jgi:hypothetical protein
MSGRSKKTIAQRAAEQAAGSSQHQHTCSACGMVLQRQHLRVSLSPPDRPWVTLRFHDGVCLADWASDEVDKHGAGKVLCLPEFVDSTVTLDVVPVT